jgi:zinc D-Ala-D-Ala dipeptidase
VRLALRPSFGGSRRCGLTGQDNPSCADERVAGGDEEHMMSKQRSNWLDRPPWGLALAGLLGCVFGCAPAPGPTEGPPLDRAVWSRPPAELAPGDRELIDEYDSDEGIRFIIEDGGSLWLLDTTTTRGSRTPLRREQGDAAARGGNLVASSRGPDGHDLVTVGDLVLRPRRVGPQGGADQLQIRPVRSMEEVRAEAMRGSPPVEAATAQQFDLVELVGLDPTIRLDIRYATTNNFLGTRFYDEPRAFLQRPAAEALVRAHRSLAALGYGLLIYDGYRPWYVTKMFWEATPVDERWLVADPSRGSRHNRGAAIDVTLYDRRSGRPVSMPSTYDETTGRASASYPGGTSVQRWHRALLREAMVAQGFLVNPTEWWHFDYKDWRDYPLGNVAFSDIGR